MRNSILPEIYVKFQWTLFKSVHGMKYKNHTDYIIFPPGIFQ